MPGAGSPTCIARQSFHCAVVITPPANPGVMRSASVCGDLFYRGFGEQLTAVPLSLAKHKPADASDRARGVAAAAPRGDPGQNGYVDSLSIDERPCFVLHT